MTSHTTKWTTLLFALLGVSACGGTSDAAEPPQEPDPVAIYTVEAEAPPLVRAFTGELRAETESRLSMRTGGTIVELPYEVGDSIRAGLPIARLDEADLRSRLREAQANLRSAAAAEERARREWTRTRSLYEADAASGSALDAALTAATTAEEAAAAARERVELARIRLSEAVLRSPADGVVTERFVEPGENVGIGQPVLAVATGAVSEVKTAVPETLVGLLAPGDTARVSVNGRANPLVATISDLGAAPAAERSTYPVVLELTAPPVNLRPGYTARVEFSFERDEASVHYVPLSALRRRDGRTFVLVVTEESGNAIAHVRDVSVVSVTDSGVIVSGELPAGTAVVSAGPALLTEGSSVRVTREDR